VDGIIYLSLVTDGASGEDWIFRLEKAGDKVGRYAKIVLRSKKFIPTKKTHQVAIIKGSLLKDQNNFINELLKEAKLKKLARPTPELACIFREKFSNEDLEEMGLNWVVVMHRPAYDLNNDPIFLGIGRFGFGDAIKMIHGTQNVMCNHGFGFLFVLRSQRTLAWPWTRKS